MYEIIATAMRSTARNRAKVDSLPDPTGLTDHKTNTEKAATRRRRETILKLILSVTTVFLSDN